MTTGGGIPVIRYDLARYGVVSAVTSPTVFDVGGLAGAGLGAFVGYSIYVLRKGTGTGGAPQGEVQLITTYVNSSGQFTIAGGYTVSIAVGDEILAVHPAIAGALLVGPSAAQIAKLAGLAPVVGNTIANWNAAEANLIILGANDVRNKVHSLIVGIQNCVGAITIRMYTQVNGVERQIFPTPLATTFTVAADGPAIVVINGTWGIHEALRVTCQSNAAGDNGAAIDYDALLEAM